MEKKRGNENFASFCLGGTSKFGNDLAQPTPSVSYDSTSILHTRTQPRSRRGTFRGCSERCQTRLEGVLDGEEQVVELLNFA